MNSLQYSNPLGYTDMLAIWDAFNGAEAGTSQMGTPAGWTATRFWVADDKPFREGFQRAFSFENGVATRNEFAFNFDVAFEVL
jgi:hypothetical protein